MRYKMLLLVALLAILLVACQPAAAPTEQATEAPAEETEAAGGGVMTEIGEGEGALSIVAWAGYIANMTIYADVRYHGVVFPVIGWWLYDIFYITPFLAIPYLHTVNREIFTD